MAIESYISIIGLNVCVCAQSCPALCNPMHCWLPGSSVNGILQARILEWVAFSYSREFFQPSDRTHISRVSWIGRCILYHCTTWKPINWTKCSNQNTLTKYIQKQNKYIAYKKPTSDLGIHTDWNWGNGKGYNMQTEIKKKKLE